MSLDLALVEEDKIVESFNITHNVSNMARVIDLYFPLWRPEESGFHTAKMLIRPLKEGISVLRNYPGLFTFFEASNGWGTRLQFVFWLEGLLAVCKKHPHAKVTSYP